MLFRSQWKKMKSLESKEILFTPFPLIKICYCLSTTLIPLFLYTRQNNYPKIKVCSILDTDLSKYSPTGKKPQSL